MESVPDIVQLTDNEADIEKKQEYDAANSLPDFNLPAEQIQKSQEHRANTAVEIGKTFLKGGLQTAAHIAGNLPHSIQKAFPGVIGDDIQPESIREFIDAGIGILKCSQSGQFQKCGHANSQHREKRNGAKVGEETANALAAANLIAEEKQKYKNAGKEADIVVGSHRKEQGGGVENEFTIPQQAQRTQHHQRQ